ncbi:hypothetical protein IU429_15200 [Nocardia elegans]|uniref:Uncharacterized protein n=1 Tax=Nocardia elegans TaxID=300029 RepID=A0ABW6T7Z4_9NOCA|nr:hypothetical protein [Nocardia elegans]MBF6449017.1 hypothetical protein [Nocardia elegans]
MGARFQVAWTKQLISRLPKAMKAAGYNISTPPQVGPSPKKVMWTKLAFHPAPAAIPGMTRVIDAFIKRQHDGGLSLSGIAHIGSPAVEEIMEDLPGEGLTLKLGDIDTGLFELLDEEEKFPIMIYADVVDRAVADFMTCVRGPVQTWFDKRSTFPALLQTAREPTTVPWETNPDPTVLRGTVLLCILDDRASDAAALMDWYLHREQLHQWDSLADAIEFDTALRKRFPGYASAREVR